MSVGPVGYKIQDITSGFDRSSQGRFRGCIIRIVDYRGQFFRVGPSGFILFGKIDTADIVSLPVLKTTCEIKSFSVVRKYPVTCFDPGNIDGRSHFLSADPVEPRFMCQVKLTYRLKGVNIILIEEYQGVGSQRSIHKYTIAQGYGRKFHMWSVYRGIQAFDGEV